MLACNFNFTALGLSKSLFHKIIYETDNIQGNAILISPLGNYFIMGDPDASEEYDIDEVTTEVVIYDVAGTRRRITFKKHDDLEWYSEYGVVVTEDGCPWNSTGIKYDVKTDDPEHVECCKIETGFVDMEGSCFEEE